MTVCAVIPAAGRGTRLAVDVPKILVPVYKERTIWNILSDLLAPFVDHINVVLSPVAEAPFLNALKQDSSGVDVSVSIQEKPIGMGDAIFGAHSIWSKFDTLLLVWGDQVNLSRQTIDRVLEASAQGPGLVLPLTTTRNPYVQYMFENERLVDVRQTREGAKTDEYGDSDVGLFVLSVPGLNEQWQKFLSYTSLGESTGELNFLPFLTYLSSQSGWPVRVVKIDDCDEARGVNTPDDLAFAQKRFQSIEKSV